MRPGRSPVIATGLLLAVWLWQGSLRPAMAQAPAPDGPAVSISGAVQHEQVVSAADLEAMPSIASDVTFATGHGDQHAHYVGVPLWALIERAGGLRDTAHAASLHHTLTVTGRDGYWIVLALGELDPEFGGKAAFIAYQRDGAPLRSQDGLRLVLPGDKRGGRSVRDVVKIDVQ
jgi:DMSO/TMAO reductase YedYZ molybdopterin-dependent catalytic subunit